MNKFSKRICKVLGVVTGMWVAGASFATGAQADVIGWVQGDIVTISGEAGFVKHRTLTPQYCPDYRPENTGSEGCLKGKTYWSLSVQSGGMRYELDLALAEGEEQVPESLTIGGVVVRQGVSISVTAQVKVVNRAYAMLTDLKEILILDRHRNALEFFGWTCESVGESQPVYVDIYQDAHAELYSMRVQTMVAGEANPRTLASLEGVTAELTDSSILFSGVGQHIDADLAIDAKGGVLSGRASLLKITTRIPAHGRGYAEVPVEAAIKLVCGRTR